MSTDTGPGAPFAGRRPPGRAWSLQVERTDQITPRMRRVTFGGEDLAEFEWKPGQDLSLRIPMGPDQEPARRHYTLRDFDPAKNQLAIDFFLHGDTPGPRWAKAAKPGDPLGAQGPRGRTTVDPAADWHLFTGDETCIPGVFAIAERLGAGKKAYIFLEVADAAEQQPLASAAEVALVWIVRNGPPAASSPALIDAFAKFAFPPGLGRAYVIGETSTVRAQRQGLIARGFPKAQISAEGYWRPGRVGGHDHNWD